MANQIILSEDGDGSVPSEFKFQVKREKLGEFVKGLLGQPFEIGRRISGQFDLQQEDVNQLFRLIEQRISQQNEYELIEFNGKIGYEDGHFRALTDKDAFFHYNDTANIKSISVNFIATFLILFPGKDIPEKQEIEFNAYSNGKISISAIGGGRHGIEEFSNKYGMYYSIRSTERTWAEDIDNLMRNSLEKRTIRERKFYQIRAWIRSGAAWIIAAAAIGIPVIVEYFRYKSKILNIELPTFNRDDDVADVFNSIVRVFSSYFESGMGIGEFIYYAVFFVFTLFFAIYIGTGGEEKRSFIVFNKNSENEMEKFRKAQEGESFKLFRDIIIGFGASILANYTFYYISLGI